jgi:hypothetical protein
MPLAGGRTIGGALLLGVPLIDVVLLGGHRAQYPGRC